MHKIKLKISGMHCQACTKTIEEKLTKESGVLSARVDYDSQKAVIIYDEQSIDWQKINQIIKGSGNFEAEIISESAEQILTEAKAVQKEPDHEYPSDLDLKLSKINFFIRLLVGVGIASLALNIFLGINLYKFSAAASDNSVPIVNDNAPALPSAPTPQPQAPQQAPKAPETIQAFQITKADHVRGDFNAPITLVEFSDFECPYSARHFPTMKKILDAYQGNIRLVYKHFPLGFHANAQKAAEASECADEQGKFWEYHDLLFANQPNGYSLENFKQWAKELGLNASKFNICLDSGKYSQKVQADYQEGANKGVNGTPATFVNGQLISGAVPYESFKQIIDSASGK